MLNNFGACLPNFRILFLAVLFVCQNGYAQSLTLSTPRAVVYGCPVSQFSAIVNATNTSHPSHIYVVSPDGDTTQPQSMFHYSFSRPDSLYYPLVMRSGYGLYKAIVLEQLTGLVRTISVDYQPIQASLVPFHIGCSYGQNGIEIFVNDPVFYSKFENLHVLVKNSAGDIVYDQQFFQPIGNSTAPNPIMKLIGLPSDTYSLRGWAYGRDRLPSQRCLITDTTIHVNPCPGLGGLGLSTVSLRSDSSFNESTKETSLFDRSVEFEVFPNPTSGIVTVKGSGSFVLLNIFGQYLQQYDIVDNGQITLDLSTYSNGIYLIRDSNGKIIKFVKN